MGNMQAVRHLQWRVCSRGALGQAYPRGRSTGLAHSTFCWSLFWGDGLLRPSEHQRSCQILQLLCLTNSLLCSIISHPYHPCDMTENTRCGLPILQGAHSHARVLCTGCSCNKGPVCVRVDVSCGVSCRARLHADRKVIWKG